MPLRGQVILIVEPGVTSFISQLQDAIEHSGGESIVAPDPATGIQRCERFRFSAALVSTEHRDLVGKLTMPAMLYDPADGYRSVVERLKTLVPPHGRSDG